MRNTVFLMAFVVILAGTATAQELLTNPGFETGDLTGWTGTGSNTIHGPGWFSGASPRSGNWGWGTASNWGTGSGLLTQDVSVSPGTTYHVSGYFWLFTDSTYPENNRARIRIRWFDSGMVNILTNQSIYRDLRYTAGSTWFRVRERWTAPAGAVTARFWPEHAVDGRTGGGWGVATGDDFSFTALTTTPITPLVTETVVEEFEAAGWNSDYYLSGTAATQWSYWGRGSAGTGNPVSSGNAAFMRRLYVDGSEVYAKVTPWHNATGNVNVWCAVPAWVSGTYWMECGVRDGARTAQDFDANPGSWTMVVKAANSGGDMSHNSDTWTKYTKPFTVSGSQFTYALKSGMSGGGAAEGYFDLLSLSGALPVADWYVY